MIMGFETRNHLTSIFKLTSAAGFPPDEIHSSSISLSSVVTMWSMLVLPFTIFGSSGGTRTVTLAYRDRIAGVPSNWKINCESEKFRAEFMRSVLTVGTWADLTLISCIIVEHYGRDIEREVALLVAPHHRVSIEAAQVPMHAQPEVVLRPLDEARLGNHSTGQRHTRANDGRLVLGLHRKPLRLPLLAATAVELCRGGHRKRQENYPQQQKQRLHSRASTVSVNSA